MSQRNLLTTQGETRECFVWLPVNLSWSASEWMNEHKRQCRQSSAFLIHRRKSSWQADCTAFHLPRNGASPSVPKDAFLVEIFLGTAREAESHWQMLSLWWKSSLVLHSNIGFSEKWSLHGGYPPMNLSDQDKVLSSFELVLKKSHEFGDRRKSEAHLSPANLFGICEWTLEIQRFFFFFICSEFCHTLKWKGLGFTCLPHPDPTFHLPPHQLPPGPPRSPGPSTCLMHPTWAGNLFHPWQYTYFDAVLLKHQRFF